MKGSQVALSTPWSECLSAFVGELSLSRSDTTVEAYARDTKQFLGYLTEKGVTKKKLKAQHIVTYLGLCKRSHSDASVQRYYMSIRSFCKHLRRARHVQEDLTQDIAVPKAVLKPPRVPTMQEMERLLQQPDIETCVGLRDRAILELLYSSGLRASELCDLEPRHVIHGAVLVSCGKGGKTRTVPLTEEAYTWIQLYQEEWHYPREYLFVSMVGRKLRRQLLSKIVEGYARQAGISEVTAHTLRHACATHLLEQGADLRLIQEVLGHATIASTQRYTQLSSRKLQQMFKQFHPRDKEASCKI